jgi:hypothetical protein
VEEESVALRDAHETERASLDLVLDQLEMLRGAARECPRKYRAYDQALLSVRGVRQLLGERGHAYRHFTQEEGEAADQAFTRTTHTDRQAEF